MPFGSQDLGAQCAYYYWMSLPFNHLSKQLRNMCVCVRTHINVYLFLHQSVYMYLKITNSYQFLEFKSNASGFFPAIISTFPTSKNSDFNYSYCIYLCAQSLYSCFWCHWFPKHGRHLLCLPLPALVGVLLRHRVACSPCQWPPTDASLYGTVLYSVVPQAGERADHAPPGDSSSPQALPELGLTLTPLHQEEIRRDCMYMYSCLQLTISNSSTI